MAVKIKEEAKGIYRLVDLDTGHDSGPTSPYVVKSSEKAMVVEPSQDGQASQIVQGIKELGIDLNRVAYIFATHIHLYHVQGAPVLLKLLPQAKLLVHPRAVRHVIDPTVLNEQTKQIWTVETPEETARGIKKCYGAMLPVPADRVMGAEDNQIIDLGEKKLQVIHSPGHASHHMGLFDLETKVLFCGDLDAGVGTFGGAGGASVTIFDTDQHINSLRRYRALNPSFMLRHGRPNPLPTQILLETELDMLTAERIALQGMREKVTMAEIDRRVNQYNELVKSLPGGSSEQIAPGRSTGSGIQPHVLANIKRKHPELELPPDIMSKSRPQEGARARGVQR